MNIIIYESSSFGGCYKYSIELYKAFNKLEQVLSCQLILPKLSDYTNDNVNHLLCRDNKIFRVKLFNKLYFIIRSLVNPIILFFFLLRSKKSVVLINDFEQLTAFFWVPFLKLLKYKHTFGIYLHDPDRDSYPPSPVFAKKTMNHIMSLMSFAFYHDVLPDKEYYNRNKKTIYISVPHGIYPKHTVDETLVKKLREIKNEKGKIIGILGNIREEKNYDTAIRVLSQLDKHCLLIAGKKSSTEVSVEEYKRLADTLHVSHRIVWLERFLSEEEFNACIQESDIIWLCYKNTFKSQSAILNQVAPYNKKIIVSDTESSLTNSVEKFNIGPTINSENVDQIIRSITVQCNDSYEKNYSWGSYLNYASWENHAEIVFRTILNNR